MRCIKGTRNFVRHFVYNVKVLQNIRPICSVVILVVVVVVVVVAWIHM